MCISGAFSVIPFAICFSNVVFPALGGDTIKPLCPLPTGDIMSIKRVDNSLGVVSRIIMSSGNTGVKFSNLSLFLEPSGSVSLTFSTLTRPKYLSPSFGGLTFPAT